MIDTISTFLTDVVYTLWAAIDGLVNAIGGSLTGE